MRRRVRALDAANESLAMWARRACKARRWRSSGASTPPGSTWFSNPASHAALAGAVSATPSFAAWSEWAPILARSERWAAVMDMGVPSFQPPTTVGHSGGVSGTQPVAITSTSESTAVLWEWSEMSQEVVIFFLL